MLKNTLMGLASLLFLLSICLNAFADDDIEQRIKALEDASKAQQRTIDEQQKKIDELNKGARPEENADAQKPSGMSGLFGGSALSNPNISLILNAFFYSSNLRKEELATRGIPGFTNTGITKTKGFNLDSAELFLFAPVDPYFNLYAAVPFTENGATVEEAFFVTTSLPQGLQIKGGKFKSGFGRHGAQHPHAWSFADAPLVYRAFAREEGVTEKGAQLTYLPQLPLYTQFGVEVLQGENDVLFGADAKTGPHAYAGFAKASFDIGGDSTVLFGPSVITGKTKTSSVENNAVFSGRSTLYAFEFTYKWKPSKTRSFVLQSEYLYRDQNGRLDNAALIAADPLKRSQDGAYGQGVYRLGRWGLGARYDRLGIFADKYLLNGAEKNFGNRPWKAAADVEFNPTEFARLRLQYNHDRSGGDNRTNREILLQLVFGIGAHAAHPF